MKHCGSDTLYRMTQREVCLEVELIVRAEVVFCRLKLPSAAFAAATPGTTPVAELYDDNDIAATGCNAGGCGAN